jgi:methionyl-tRNA formyltransferase
MSAVKQRALALGLPVEQPATLRDPAIVDRLGNIKADVMVVAAYGLMLPAAVLAIPPHGCLNIHASLLPRWRGAAPIQRAILAGDRETGVCIMQMDQGLDTGAVLMRAAIPIAPDETAGELHDRLAALGAEQIVQVLADLPFPEPQPAEGVTYAAKLTKEEAVIEWNVPAATLVQRVRAFNPVPGAMTTLSGAPLKIWRARTTEGDPGPSGAVLPGFGDRLVVACSAGSAVELMELQRAGGRRLDARAFMAGHKLVPGTRFGE